MVSNTLLLRFHAKSNVFFYDTSTIKVPKLTIKKTKDNIKGEKQEVPEVSGEVINR